MSARRRLARRLDALVMALITSSMAVFCAAETGIAAAECRRTEAGKERDGGGTEQATVAAANPPPRSRPKRALLYPARYSRSRPFPVVAGISSTWP